MSNIRKVELDEVSSIGSRVFLDTRNEESKIVLQDILSELTKVRMHLELISGERITNKEIRK